MPRSALPLPVRRGYKHPPDFENSRGRTCRTVLGIMLERHGSPHTGEDWELEASAAPFARLVGSEADDGFGVAVEYRTEGWVV